MSRGVDSPRKNRGERSGLVGCDNKVAFPPVAPFCLISPGRRAQPAAPGVTPTDHKQKETAMSFLFRDRAAEKAAKASDARKVAKMRGVPNKVTAGRAVPKAAAPYTCGRRHHDGSSCQSTVRGGHCPCRDC